MELVGLILEILMERMNFFIGFLMGGIVCW